MGESAEPYKEFILEMREFIREMMLRSERISRDQDRWFRKAHEDWRREFERTSREHQKILDELRDLREESQAQRGALLALIHEIRGGGPAPAT